MLPRWRRNEHEREVGAAESAAPIVSSYIRLGGMRSWDKAHVADAAGSSRQARIGSVLSPPGVSIVPCCRLSCPRGSGGRCSVGCRDLISSAGKRSHVCRLVDSLKVPGGGAGPADAAGPGESAYRCRKLLLSVRTVPEGTLVVPHCAPVALGFTLGFCVRHAVWEVPRVCFAALASAVIACCLRSRPR